MSETASELAGQADRFTARRWLSQILQLAYSQFAVRHAAIALGALHEFLLDTEPGLSDPAFAVRQYTKALKGVIELDVTNLSRCYNSILTSSILFAAFESLRGRNKIALKHFIGGFNVFSQQDDEVARRSAWPDEVHFQVFRSLMADMDFENRLRVDNAVVFFNAPTPDWLDSSLPDYFVTIDEARVALETLIQGFHGFIRTSGAQSGLNSDVTDYERLLLERRNLMGLFHRWRSALVNSGFNTTAPGVLPLRIKHLIYHVQLHVDTAQGELGWDRFEPQFREIVILAELFNTQRRISYNHGEDRFSFTLSTGMLRPISCTVHRCRHPFIRRRALDVLKFCNRIEVSGTSVVIARIAQRIVEIEEASAVNGVDRSTEGAKDIFGHNKDQAEARRVSAAWQIPEVARIATIEKSLLINGNWKILYRKSGSANLYMEDLK